MKGESVVILVNCTQKYTDEILLFVAAPEDTLRNLVILIEDFNSFPYLDNSTVPISQTELSLQFSHFGI